MQSFLLEDTQITTVSFINNSRCVRHSKVGTIAFSIKRYTSLFF